MRRQVYKKIQPDEIKRSCIDCDYCQAAASWWCINKDAIACHKTQIPELIPFGCKFWIPIEKYSFFKHFFRKVIIEEVQ